MSDEVIDVNSGDSDEEVMEVASCGVVPEAVITELVFNDREAVPVAGEWRLFTSEANSFKCRITLALTSGCQLAIDCRFLKTRTSSSAMVEE